MTKGKTKRGSKRKPASVDQRSYVCLFYPDNLQHMRAFHRIQKRLPDYYLGAWHIQHDQDGAEVMTADGKKHLHLVLHLKNEKRWEKLSADLGLDWSAENGCRWLRPVGYGKTDEQEKRCYTYRGALVYLVHRNAPEKTQFPTDILFGSEDMRLQALKYIRAEESKRITCAEALDAVRAWLYNRRGTVVTSSDFLGWYLNTPYQPFLQNRWIFEMIADHNKEAYQQIMGTFRPAIQQNSFAQVQQPVDDDDNIFDWYAGREVAL